MKSSLTIEHLISICLIVVILKGEVVSSVASSSFQNRENDAVECQPQRENGKRSKRIPKSCLQEEAHQELMKKIKQRIAAPMEGIEVNTFDFFSRRKNAIQIKSILI
jgi:hypothetical protein